MMNAIPSETRYIPFFSIVIPVHNKRPHIGRSVGSALRQSFKDFELIVVNDCSTDGSIDEVLKFKDQRIRLLDRDEPGPGGYAARNLGTRVSRAAWVAFLDADDEWSPYHLRKYKKLTEEYPSASVLGAGCYISDPDRKADECMPDSYYRRRKDWGNHLLSFREYLEAESLGLRPLNGSTACIRKDALLVVGGFPEGRANRGGDVDTWLRCIEYAGGIAWSSHIGAIYYKNAVNMVTKTQPFLAEVERDTVRHLLARYHGAMATSLKRFANKRTLSAWRENTSLTNTKNFFLPNKLYWGVDICKNLAWSMLSVLPAKVFHSLHQTSTKIRRRSSEF